MSLSMTFVRWVLSHMALILVLSLVLYLYWDQDEGLPADEKENTQAAFSYEQEFPEQYEPLSRNTAWVNGNTQEPENKKSFEKHAIIEPESQKKLVYPGDIINVEQTSSVAQVNVVRSDIVQNDAVQSSVNKENVNKKDEEPTKAEQGQENLKAVNFQNKDLQEQITARQKKLSNQMVSLIAVTMNDSETDSYEEQTEQQVEEQLAEDDEKTIDIVSVEPVIETPEQRQLLFNARQAFEEQNFTIAEEKYLQLMNLLPELPDVVGELANVYKTQNRQTDYIAMNTRFVKRLTEHNRFSEAWGVVSETTKIDKKTANKQRRIINKKQKELGLTN